MGHEPEPGLTNAEQAQLNIPGATLSTEDLLGIANGVLEGHYWKDETGQICDEGTINAGDVEFRTKLIRGLMNKHPFWQYGGEITPTEAQALLPPGLYNDRPAPIRPDLWEVWITELSKTYK